MKNFSSTFIPSDDRYLVNPLAVADVTAGGIILPETAKEKPTMGVIISSGPGHETDDGTVLQQHFEIGDVVLYGKWSGQDIEVWHEGRSVIMQLMRDHDIFGVVRKKGTYKQADTVITPQGKGDKRE